MEIPAPSCDYAHRQDIQMRFADADLFGHVNNAVIMQYFDQGKLGYFRAVMGDDFDMRGIALVVVNTNCNFYAPVFLDEQVAVLSGTAHIGEKSLRLEQRLVSSTGDVKAICTTVMVGFDPATSTSAPIAPLWRERLEISQKAARKD